MILIPTPLENRLSKSPEPSGNVHGNTWAAFALVARSTRKKHVTSHGRSPGNMCYSLNSLKGLYIGDHVGDYCRGY